MEEFFDEQELALPADEGGSSLSLLRAPARPAVTLRARKRGTGSAFPFSSWFPAFS
jgi:hypothetical protein